VPARGADRRRRLALVALVITLVAVAVAIVLTRPSPSALGRAQDLADDAAHFAAGREAGDTLARISSLLEDDAEACRDRHGLVPACEARFSAAAWARVAAATALSCTAPGRTELRRAAVDHLAAVAALRMSSTGDDVPEPPGLPRCPAGRASVLRDGR
jgi:hypothetical protein